MAILRWVLAVAVGAFLIFFGVTKFTGGAHIFPYIEFKASGLGIPFAEFAFPWLNYAVGALEIGAGVLLILPTTRKLGAFISLAPFFGAVLFHLSPLLGVSTPVGYANPAPTGALAAGGPFAAADFSTEMTTALFMVAVGGLIAAIVNLIVQRNA